MKKISDLELIEILASIFKEKESEITSDDFDVDSLVYNNFGVEVEDFKKIVSTLLPLCASWKSPLTDKLYHGFVDKEKGCAVIKREGA